MMSDKCDLMPWRAEVTDLWGDVDGGWSANCSWVRRVELMLPAHLSKIAIARRIKSALGIQGMKKDYWAGTDLCWREGAVGAWAEPMIWAMEE